jgi:hypothetical protein
MKDDSMLRLKKDNKAYTGQVSGHETAEGLLREILQRVDIGFLRNSLLQIEMNTRFKKLREKTEYSKRHLFMDMSVLLDSNSPKLLDELHRSEMLSIVIVPQYISDNISRFSTRDIEELEGDLKLWTRRKVDAQWALDTLKSFFRKIQESCHLEIIGAIDYLGIKLSIENATLIRDEQRILEKIKGNFKKKYEFAAKVLSEGILVNTVR